MYEHSGPITTLALATVGFSLFNLVTLRWWLGKKDQLSRWLIVPLFLVFIIATIFAPLFLLSQLIGSAKLATNTRQIVFLFVIMTWLLPGAIYIVIRCLRVNRRDHTSPAELMNTQPVDFNKIVEFKSQMASYQRVVFRTFVYLCILFIFAFALVYIVVRRLVEIGLDVTCLIVLAVLIPTIAVLMVYLLLKPEKCMRKLGLVCPACGKSLVGWSSRAVIATGRCGACGGQVL